MRRSLSIFGALTALAMIAGGCSSQKNSTSASMGVMSGPSQVLSLGAGDTLGRDVYVNDLILAAAAYEPDTTYVNVDEVATPLD